MMNLNKFSVFLLVLFGVFVCLEARFRCPYAVRCPNECPYGFETLPGGCPTCTCRDPCKKVKCKATEHCEVRVIYCIRAPCPPPYGECVPNKVEPECPNEPCGIRCMYGLATDDNGCQLCKCVNPCAAVSCLEGEQCVVEQPPCFVAPCPYVGTCYPNPVTTTCPEVSCPTIKCAYGFATDNNGCPICQCSTYNPCAATTCLAGSQCVVEGNPPTGVCRPNTA